MGRTWTKKLADPWDQLTEPHPSIQSEEQRRSARLLSALLLAGFPLALIGIFLAAQPASPAPRLVQPYWLVAAASLSAIAINYGLSRTAHYQWAVWLTVVSLTLANFATVIMLPEAPLFPAFLILGPLLSSLLLSPRATLFVAVAVTMSILLLPVIAPEQRWEVIPSSVYFTLTASVLIVVAAFLREYNLREVEQKRRELFQSEARYRTLVDASPDGITLTDLDGRVRLCNAAALRLQGFTSLEEAARSNFFDFISPEDRPRAMDHALRMRVTGRGMLDEYAMVRKDGTRFPAELDVAMVKDALGNATAFISVARDITERKRAAESLQRGADEFAALYETTRDLAGIQPDLPALLQTIVQRAVALLHASDGGIYLYDAKRGDLVVQTATNPLKLVGSRVQLGEGMAGRVAQTRQPLIVDDYRTWPHALPVYKGTPLTAVIEVPMLYGGELIGVLTVEEFKESGRKFTEEDARLLTIFAGQAAAAVRSARLFHDTQQLNAELEDRIASRTAELNRVNDRLEYLLSSSPAVIYTASLEENLPATYYSENVREQLGYTPEQFTSDPRFWISHVHPDDLERVTASINKLLQEGELVTEYRFRHSNGEYRWKRDSARLMRSEGGQPLEMIGTWVDITERKQAEEELHYRLKLEHILSTISTSLIKTQAAEVDEAITQALQAIGTFVGVDRSYVFLLSKDGAAMSNTHEWSAEGIEPQIDNLRGLPVEMFPWWMRKLRHFENIHIPLVADLPPEAKAEKEILQAQGILSLLVIPLVSNSTLTGFMGFDSVRAQKAWAEEDIVLLRMAGEIVINALSRKAFDEQVASSLREKEVLVREVHHRVKNNLQLITSLLNLRRDGIQDETIRRIFRDIQDRVQAMALVHERLYRSANLARVDLSEYAQSLVAFLLRSYQMKQGIINLKLDVRDVSLNPETAIPCGLIITELVTNSLKHAFPHPCKSGAKPEITVAVRPRADGRYTLTVSDNGVGLPEGFEGRGSAGTGLQLVYLLARQLNGAVRIRRGSGTHFQITFAENEYKDRS